MHLEIARLARNSLIYGAGQILTRFISVLLLPVFTSYLSPADYGVSSILSLMTFFLTPVFGLGIGTALGIVYFERSDRTHKDATIWTGALLLTVSGLILTGIGAIFRHELAQLLFPTEVAGYNYDYLVIVVLATAAISIVVQPLMMYLQFEERAAAFVALTLCSTLTTIALSIVMVVFLRRGIQGMLEASLIGQVVTVVLALLPLVGRAHLAASRTALFELLKLGIPLIPSFVFVSLILQVNRYLLQVDIGLGAVGVYTIGYNFGFFMTLLVSGFTSAWYPFFMSYMERQEDAKRLFGRIFSYYVIGFGALTLLFYMAARPGVLVLTHGTAYHGAYVVVGPSATAQFLVGCHSMLLAGMYFAKKVKYQPVVQGIAAVGAIAINLVLIPLIGVTGAAIALACGFGMVVVLQHIWNVKAHYLAVEYEWGRVSRFCAIYLAYAVVFMWNRDLPLSAEIVGSVVGTGVLAGLLYSLLLPSERSMLWRVASRVVRRDLAIGPYKP